MLEAKRGVFRFRQLLSLDPSTFLIYFATWDIMTGISLLYSPVFSTIPAYHILKTWVIPEWAWGTAAITDSIALIISVVFLCRPWYRCGVALFSASMWMIYGYGLFTGSATVQNPYFSVTGATLFIGGIGCLLAVAQWVAQE